MSTPTAPRYEKCANAAAVKQATLCEEVEWQLSQAQGWWTAMQAVGYKNQASLYRRLQRAGRPDLAAVFNPDIKP